VSSCEFKNLFKFKGLCDILPNTLQNGLQIQGSHSHSYFAKHFTKWLQLHQRSHYIRVAAAATVSAIAEALPKGP
jgi:hypothetical protein